jgi:hypothetical protein
MPASPCHDVTAVRNDELSEWSAKGAQVLGEDEDVFRRRLLGGCEVGGGMEPASRSSIDRSNEGLVGGSKDDFDRREMRDRRQNAGNDLLAVRTEISDACLAFFR